ncbi:MAG: hypothetical protein KAW51_01090 [Candidatus Lokiarchaeota archaeon]|nr:hypothetical protein [Candidatus Lokiarchaeota archaeon]MCK4480450.1 hypothetical protein [Candidatus Lokiarchaeota archaeon]
MAQAIKSKDVRINCADVEQVIMECLTKPEREEIREIAGLNQFSELNKKLLNFSLKYNAKYHQELIPIERVKYKLTYRNYAVY